MFNNLHNWGVLRFLTLATIAGCLEGNIFNPTEDLPQYPGVSSELKLLKGQKRMDVLERLFDLNKIDETKPIVVQQVIQNDSDESLWLYATPALQAEYIVVRTAGGERVDHGRAISESPPAGIASTGIRPQETQRRAYVLTWMFELSEPGIYTVEIESRYSVKGKSKLGYFETNPEPIKFEVK